MLFQHSFYFLLSLSHKAPKPFN